MAKINVALLAGGNSSEREIALQSASQLMEAFDKQKYDVFLIDVKGADWCCINSGEKESPVDKNDFSVNVDGKKVVFDYAYITIHGTPGEDGKMQGYLDMMSVPYSSCGVVATALTFDKSVCKKMVSGIEELNLAKEILIRKGEKVDSADIVARLGLPIFVKPNASGSSFGVTKVKEEKDIETAVISALEEGDSVLIEEFIEGREFSCGFMLTEKQEYSMPPTEIIAKNDFFDYESKYTPGFSEEITPADIPQEWTDKIHRIGRKAYRACNCRGMVRIDFIVNGQGEPYLIEINTVPGMSKGSIVPKQLTAARMTMTQFLDIVIEDTYDTHNDRDRR